MRIRILQNIPTVALEDALRRHAAEQAEREAQIVLVVEELIERQRDALAKHILTTPHGDEDPTVRMRESERLHRQHEAWLMHRAFVGGLSCG